MPGAVLVGLGALENADFMNSRPFASRHTGALLPSGRMVQVKPLLPGRRGVTAPLGSIRATAALAAMWAGPPSSAALMNAAWDSVFWACTAARGNRSTRAAAAPRGTGILTSDLLAWRPPRVQAGVRRRLAAGRGRAMCGGPCRVRAQ